VPIRRLRQLLAAQMIVATSLLLCGIPTASAKAEAFGFDCAHGPDTYRVRNVADWDKLNIRGGPSALDRIVGRIDADGSGILCEGPCKGSWCRISWRGTVGWTNMRYLGE
jgi:uncharacterized protein YraI